MGLFVYFIQAGADGPIKIGTAADVQRRLWGMQSGNHERLALLGAIPSRDSLEPLLHKRFAEGRIRGEWFRPDTPGLADLIATVLRDRVPVWAVPHVRLDHGVLMPEALDDDPYVEQCERCGWPVQQELADRSTFSCWRCLSEMAA